MSDNRVTRFFLKNKFPLILVALSSVVYFRWISFDYLINGDWFFWFKESYSDKLWPSIWKGNFSMGQVEPTPFRAALESISSLSSDLLSIDSNIVDKVLYLWPIVFLLPVASYLFLKKVIKHDVGAAVGSLVICYNTYFLTIDTVGHNMITVAAIFCLLSMYYIFESIEKDNIRDTVIASMFLSVGGYYDFRVVYINIFILTFLLFYFVKIGVTKNIIKHTSVFVLCFFLLNIFWVLPIPFLSGSFGGDILSRYLFGDQYWSIKNAITLSHPFWSSHGVLWFTSRPVSLYFWLIPIFAILGFVFNRRNLLAVLFSIIAIIGIFLTKQTDQPFGQLYKYLYDHFPGFSAFREASKFYYLIVIGYGVLIGFLVKSLDSMQAYNRSVTLFISAILLMSAAPLALGDIEGMFVERNMNKDYMTVKNAFVQSSEYFRSVWVPQYSPFSFYSNTHPYLGMVSLFELDPLRNYGEFGLTDKTENNIKNLLSKDYANVIFDSASVKYLIMPGTKDEKESELFYYYGGKDNNKIQELYKDILDSAEFLKRVDIGTSELLVYENQDYANYVGAVDEMIRLDSFDDLGTKYRFAINKLERDVNFFVDISDSNKSIPAHNLGLLYSNFDRSSISDKSASRIYDDMSGYTVYSKPDELNVYYKDKGQYFDLVIRDSSELYLDDTKLDLNYKDMYLATNVSKSYNDYLQVGSKIISMSGGSKALGSDNLNYSLIDTSLSSAVENGSFEYGPWNSQVADCNAYDDRGRVEQSLSNESYKGKKSIELMTIINTACINKKDIKIIPGSDYILSLTVKSTTTDKAGYYILFKGATSTAVSSKFLIEKGKWNNVYEKISVPVWAKSLDLYLYAYGTEDESEMVSVLYDDVRLSAVTKDSPLKTNNNYSQKKVAIDTLAKSGGQYNFVAMDAYRDMTNLIKNGDLSNGLWKDRVGDCNAYDDKSDISMSLHEDKNSSRSKVLNLEAVRHNACTGPDQVSVKEQATYLFSFDYKAEGTERAGYYIDLNNSKENNIQQDIPVKDNDWHTYTRYITIPKGVSILNINLYAFENNNKNRARVYYDNLYLAEMPDISSRYFYFKSVETSLEKPRMVEYRKVNNTKTKVSIRGVSAPFYLTFGESYHEGWKIDVKAEHFKLNGFLNGWYIDPKAACRLEPGQGNTCVLDENGDHNMSLTIEFAPQRWYDLGLLISGFSGIMMLGFIIYRYKITRKN